MITFGRGTAGILEDGEGRSRQDTHHGVGYIKYGILSSISCVAFSQAQKMLSSVTLSGSIQQGRI